MEPARALKRIALLLERGRAGTHRVQGCRTAAVAVAAMAAGETAQLKGIGPKTAQVIREAVAGEVPGYLQRLEEEAPAVPLPEGGERLRALLRGDCHLHSDWSDDGSPIEEMGRTAAGTGPWVGGPHRPLAPAGRGGRGGLRSPGTGAVNP